MKGFAHANGPHRKNYTTNVDTYYTVILSVGLAIKVKCYILFHHEEIILITILNKKLRCRKQIAR